MLSLGKLTVTLLEEDCSYEVFAQLWGKENLVFIVPKGDLNVKECDYIEKALKIWNISHDFNYIQCRNKFDNTPYKRETYFVLTPVV